MDETNDDYFDDFESEELDESPPVKGGLNLRRIELLKEQQWLKQQLDDFQDWTV